MTSKTVAVSPKVREFLQGPKRIYINGEFLDSANGKTFDVYNPADGEKLTEVYEGTEEDINRAVKAAKSAFESGPWMEISEAERAKLMLNLADLIEERAEEIAQIETLDNGKPINDTRSIDIPNCIDQLRYFAGWTTKNYGQTIPVNKQFFNYTKHEPVGVVGAIVPWNFPLMIALWKVAPALATGCTVVLKPAEQTPLSAIYLAELIEEAGFPKGVVNVVPGFGTTAGDALIRHADVNKIAFTGSTAVGKHIMRTAADTMKRVSLELGGKSPNIVFPDADLSKAVPGVFTGIMANQGEICSAGSRIFIHKDHYDNIVADLASYADKLKVGIGLSEESEMGPLVSKEQQDRVVNYINIGKEEGAELVHGGDSTDTGYFVSPTIFADVNDDMRICREEIFGPVVVALPYNDIDEVIERANDSEYGLAAGVWTENLKNAHNVADRLKAGSVWINCYSMVNPGTPFGGYKQSGFGRDMGSYALDNYTEVKNVWVNLE